MHGTDWPRDKIVEAIYARGYSISALERALGLGANSVFYVLRAGGRWPAVQKKVADFLGVEPHEIWPSRYRSPGIPIGQPHSSQLLTTSFRGSPRSKVAEG